MTCVLITGTVSGLGLRVHFMKAAMLEEAWARFCRAHSKHECTFVNATTPSRGRVRW